MYLCVCVCVSLPSPSAASSEDEQPPSARRRRSRAAAAAAAEDDEDEEAEAFARNLLARVTGKAQPGQKKEAGAFYGRQGSGGRQLERRLSAGQSEDELRQKVWWQLGWAIISAGNLCARCRVKARQSNNRSC